MPDQPSCDRGFVRRHAQRGGRHVALYAFLVVAAATWASARCPAADGLLPGQEYEGQENAHLPAPHLPARLQPSKLTATCYGAAGRVSGSLHLLDTGNGRWMIDCGLVYHETASDGPAPADRIEPPQPELPAAAIAASGMILTHAHLDHIGRLPLAMQQGFAGPIYLTRPTAAIAETMLRVQARFDSSYLRNWIWSREDQARAERGRKSFAVHWRECLYSRAIGKEDRARLTCRTPEMFERLRADAPRAKPALCEACIADEVAAIVKRFRPLEYDSPAPLAPGVRLTLLDAGHIPGSASALVEVTIGDRCRRVLFSGDLGSGMSPFYGRPEPATNVDAVFIECTYGAAIRPVSAPRERAEFRLAVAEAVKQGGVVWIPAFALDRTQKVFYELHLAQNEGLLPEGVTIYCPSPTARQVTALYRQHQRDGWFAEEIAADDEAWSPRRVRVTVPSARSLPRPSIIVSTNDLVQSPWMRRLLPSLLCERSTSIFLVGYHDPGTAGSRLKEGAKELVIDGQSVPVRAGVRSFGCFTGHASAADIDVWLNRVSKQATIVLVHGGPESLDARAADLRGRQWRRVIVARPGDGIDLIGGKVF